MAPSSNSARFGPALALGDQLARIGYYLRHHGLTEQAVCTCFYVTSVGHAPMRTASLTPPDSPTLAAILPWLLVAGKPLPVAAARAALGDELYETLRDVDLLTERSPLVWSEVCILPVGEAIAVSDRFGGGSAPLPDDSSFHLIGALPGRRLASWLDIGTGTGIAPLARRGLARRVVAGDINDEALDCARLGVGLSGAGEIELRNSDLFDAVEPGNWALITFNAPMPGPDDDLLDRFWQDVRTRVGDHSEVVVHSQQAHDDYIESLQLPGEVVVARYTPPGIEPAFGVTRWRPGGEQRSELRHVALTPERPHVTRGDLEW